MEKSLIEYLKDKKRIIKIDDDSGDDLSILDSLGEKDIYLAGENHGVKGNTELKKRLLNYFKEKTNFKYLLCELPLSFTYFLNQYLKSGDESILKEIYQSLKGTDAWNKEEYNFWKYLYKFNDKLPKEEKISIIGIDIEHQAENAIKYLDHMMSDKDMPQNIKILIEDIKGKDKLLEEDLLVFSQKLKKELSSNKTIYKTILKKDYLDICLVNDNISNMVEVYSSNNFDGIRDRKMYENFSRLYENLPWGKCFGQMGLSHIFQKAFPYVNWFGAALNEDNRFKDKLLSIAYAYKDCRYLYPTPRRNYIGKINTLENNIEEFSSLIKEDYTLFKLDGRNSPFKSRLIWPLSHKLVCQGTTTDYFQYLLVIKDSEAMTAL